MHCSDETLIKNNDSKVHLHVKECMQCQQRLWQLKQLQSDADKLPVFQPSELAWQKVKANLPKDNNHKYRFPLNIAASFVVGIMVTLVGNNMWQNKAIEVQIAQSSKLEQELVSMQLTSSFIEDDLWQLSKIDEQLNSDLSTSEQKELWKKRNLILQRILKAKNEAREVI